MTAPFDLSFESVSDSEMKAVREVIVASSLCAGNDVHRLPGREVLVRTDREIGEPMLAEALADAAEQRDDDLPVHLGVDLEGVAGRGGAGDDGHVGVRHADFPAQEPLPARI